MIRSAKAPMIRAGVRIANMHWKATKAISGIVPPSRIFKPIPARPSFSKLPTKPGIRPEASSPKAIV